MYAAEVPAYTTLVEVSAEVNRMRRHLRRSAGSLERVTAERHGAIRVGRPANSPTWPTCSLRSACIRSASTTCATRRRQCRWYRPRSGRSTIDQLDRNPFRVFTSMLATADARFFSAELRAPRRAVPGRAPAVRSRADRRGQAHRRRRAARNPDEAEAVRRRGGGRIRAVARTDRPRLVRGAEPGFGRGRRHRRCAPPRTSTT